MCCQYRRVVSTLTKVNCGPIHHASLLPAAILGKVLLCRFEGWGGICAQEFQKELQSDNPEGDAKAGATQKVKDPAAGEGGSVRDIE
mmetsp:Transcript_18325/g.55166  ORF Transcript_18325/g.55166 Transcript_18325/m.55166 type:complete len:87 (-) Transcript_18325:565-825(-)